MEIKTLITMVVQASPLLLIFGVGLRSQWKDLFYVFRKPKDFVRALVAVNLVVPAAAVFFCSLFPLEWPTKAGLIIMAVSPLAPFATGKMLQSSSDRSFDVGLYAALVLVAVVVVPITVAVLNPFYDRHATVSVQEVALFVIKTVLLPLVAGVLFGSIWPRIAERTARVLTLVSYGTLLIFALVFLYNRSASEVIGLVGNGTVIAIVLTLLTALAAGHWLGGSDAGHKAALAQAAATRNPGIAALIARSLHNPQVMNAVLLFLLISVALTALYGKWARRGLAQEA